MNQNSINLYVECPSRNLHDLFCGLAGFLKTIGILLHENTSPTSYLVIKTSLSCSRTWFWFRMKLRQRSRRWWKKKKKNRQEITTFHRGQKVIQWKRHRLWNQKYFNSAFSSFLILGKLHLFTETPFSHLEDCDIHGVLIKMKLDIR